MIGHRPKLDSSMGIRVGRMRVPALDDDNGISSLPRRLKPEGGRRERSGRAYEVDETRDGGERIRH
jgi:hypothetical protein